MNAIFLPILYFFYPETAGRSLEEIDMIFAKGHDENISYVKSAQQLPKLSDEEVNAMAREYGFSSSDEEGGQTKAKHSEKEGELADLNNQNAMMA